jgi:hypothetical protein
MWSPMQFLLIVVDFSWIILILKGPLLVSKPCHNIVYFAISHMCGIKGKGNNILTKFSNRLEQEVSFNAIV